MRRLLLIAFIFALATAAAGQTVSLPAATAHQVTLTWTASTSCSAAAPCTYPVFRYPAASCPTPLPATGWTAVGASASQATSYVDTGVTAGTSYIYIVQAQQGTQLSAPSNCVTATIPNAVAPPSGLSEAAQ